MSELPELIKCEDVAKMMEIEISEIPSLINKGLQPYDRSGDPIFVPKGTYKTLAEMDIENAPVIDPYTRGLINAGVQKGQLYDIVTNHGYNSELISKTKKYYFRKEDVENLKISMPKISRGITDNQNSGGYETSSNIKEKPDFKTWFESWSSKHNKETFSIKVEIDDEFQSGDNIKAKLITHDGTKLILIDEMLSIYNSQNLNTALEPMIKLGWGYNKQNSFQGLISYYLIAYEWLQFKAYKKSLFDYYPFNKDPSYPVWQLKEILEYWNLYGGDFLKTMPVERKNDILSPENIDDTNKIIIEALKEYDKSKELSKEEQPEKEQYAFYKEGDFWVIVYNGNTLHLKDLGGFKYIQYLLQNPGMEISALKLSYLVKGINTDIKSKTAEVMLLKNEEDTSELEGSKGESHINSLDEKARKQYRDRLKQLKENREEAEENLDQATIERINNEYEFINNELVNSKFDNKKGTVAEEKARKNVSKKINYAIKHIEQNDNDLADYLSKNIKLGIRCVYTPDKINLIPWSF